MRFIRRVRAWFYKRIACRYGAKLGDNVYVNGYSKFNSDTHIGNNCHFNGIKIFGGGKVSIGDNFHSGSDVQIITQNHNYDKGTKLPYDSTYVFKDVVIGKNVWLGNSVIILPGTILGDGVIVQAGGECMVKFQRWPFAVEIQLLYLNIGIKNITISWKVLAHIIENN